MLGLSKGASTDDIKGAYRKAALKWHPDRWVNGTDAEKKTAEEKFKEASEAYPCSAIRTRKPNTISSGSLVLTVLQIRTGARDSGSLNDLLNNIFGGFGGGFEGFGGFGGFGGGRSSQEAIRDVAPYVATMSP